MNAAFRRENVNGVYLALHAKTLKDLLTCVREIPIHGLSITMPYKEAILPYLDNTDSHTTKIGACNTVVRAQDGKLYGFNTDTSGVVRPLERRLSTIQDAKILVLGAGGAGSRCRIWTERTRSRSLHSEPERGCGAKAGAARPRALGEARRPEEIFFRRDRQRHAGGHGQHPRNSAAGKRKSTPATSST